MESLSLTTFVIVSSIPGIKSVICIQFYPLRSLNSKNLLTEKYLIPKAVTLLVKSTMTELPFCVVLIVE